MKLPNIDFLMNMTKEYLDGKIDSITYSLDFPHELDQRHKKAYREDDDYCELIYECLYEEGIGRFNELSDGEFKKLIRKQYNYIKKLPEKDFIKTAPLQTVGLFLSHTVCVPPLTIL